MVENVYYSDMVTQNHFFVIVVFAVLLALGVNLKYIEGIIFPFATFFFLYQSSILFIQKYQNQPRQNSLTMNILMMNGINQNILFYTLLLTDLVWKFFVDLIIIAFIFICIILLGLLIG